MCDEVSTTVPDTVCLPLVPLNSDSNNDSLEISRLVLRFVPNSLHINCFHFFSRRVYRFTCDAYPGSLLNDTNYFFQPMVFSKLAIAFSFIFEDFKTCKNTHNNRRMKYLCGPTLKSFTIHVTRFLKQWHILSHEQLPFVNELFVDSFEVFIECCKCKRA